MANRQELQDWVVAALKSYGGAANIVQVAEHIWKHHEHELRASGELFFTWQYDMRWACTRLRQRNIVRAAEITDRGQWELVA